MSLAPLRRPRRLVPGDRIAVVSPASPFPQGGLDAGLAVLRGWGLEPVVMPSAAATTGFLAGHDEARAADFAKAWLDPSIAAVIASRGGYGSQRMIELVDWEALRGAEPKAFIGFSDMTAVHEAIALELGVASVHGPMPTWTQFTGGPGMQEHLRLHLLEPERVQRIDSPTAAPLRGGAATGVTFGGTLTLLAAEAGTVHHRRDVAGGLLLLEDIGEEPYRIDRALTQLRRAGYFDGLAGVVLGSWADCGPYEGVRAVLYDQFAGIGVPVVEEFGFGHCAGSLTIPLGVEARLDADAGTLHFAVPALD
ncbi:S66 peptidase family protein [Glycomyces algeriensis]|uniref:Carboxypeptidase n=1 Tax=Glycomyces algeriensis TaxID=256037 RepID=A0A9W6GBN2_9ACTN|nr:LD-carboxypeptidase [Glycomyces algeriensis]MDA1365468.1 LD-carboxypeptidase [Glycomyces algeriensis]MDR7351154.1 muramoyltetrapeptide carboxypeptidase [Glycomyces algeriensis]GLI43867.1 putative carboxypeptidase [Glycomyces algeriensis]